MTEYLLAKCSVCAQPLVIQHGQGREILIQPCQKCLRDYHEIQLDEFRRLVMRISTMETLAHVAKLP